MEPKVADSQVDNWNTVGWNHEASNTVFLDIADWSWSAPNTPMGQSLILSVRTGQDLDAKDRAEYLPLYKCSVLLVVLVRTELFINLNFIFQSVYMAYSFWESLEVGWRLKIKTGKSLGTIVWDLLLPCQWWSGIWGICFSIQSIPKPWGVGLQ